MPNSPIACLKDIAEVRPGYTFRSKPEHDPEGAYYVLQPSDVSDRGEVELDALTRTSEVDPRDRYLVSPSTVLFVAYGTRNRAYHFEELPANTIASSTFTMVEPRGEVAPAYLAWYLNQPPAHHFYEAFRHGQGAQMISRKAFGALKVPLPPLPMQERIGLIDQLMQREEVLTQQRLAARRQLTSAASLRLAKGQLRLDQ